MSVFVKMIKALDSEKSVYSSWNAISKRIVFDFYVIR